MPNVGMIRWKMREPIWFEKSWRRRTDDRRLGIRKAPLTMSAAELIKNGAFFLLNLTWRSRSIAPQNNTDLNLGDKVFYTSDPNLVILDSMGDESSRGQICDWHMDRHIEGRRQRQYLEAENLYSECENLYFRSQKIVSINYVDLTIGITPSKG